MPWLTKFPTYQAAMEYTASADAVMTFIDGFLESRRFTIAPNMLDDLLALWADAQGWVIQQEAGGTFRVWADD